MEGIGMEERRSQSQLVIAISSLLSVIVGSISLIAFVQSSEKRITTMEIRIENLKEGVDALRAVVVQNHKPK